MSARSNRDDLFISSRREGRDEAKADPPLTGRGAAGDADAGDDDGNPLQLEHIIGYTASFSNSALIVSGSDSLFVKRFSCVRIVWNHYLLISSECSPLAWIDWWRLKILTIRTSRNFFVVMTCRSNFSANRLVAEDMAC